MERLLKLIEYGQSYWIDNLSRTMLHNGELKKRVEEQGLRGMTSNPSIFNKAISSGEAYDEQIKELVEAGATLDEIYEKLVVTDVQEACDILRPVYDQSDGLDGYVSLEVSPYLAHDAEGSIKEARRLWKAVDRPNLFIKIPGTEEGVSAIEQMLYEGVNINITLLFSIASYEAVAKAYIRALERRDAEGKPVDKVASVASFFLSRIDVLTDQLLGQRIIPEKTSGDQVRPEQLLGKVAVANAKLAYQSFLEIFSGERWEKLADKGAQVQRPLWASTSTKDPLYNDVRYVEPLIGPHTVNTMPEETIEAFADHGQIVENSVKEGLQEAHQVLEDLKKTGIDLDFVTTQLVDEGMQKFTVPFDKLMSALAKQRRKFLQDKIASQDIHFGNSESEVTTAFSSLDAKQFSRRLYQKDGTLWKAEPQQVSAIGNRLGWLNSVQVFQGRIPEMKKFAEEISAEFNFVVLLGMGGSSLCPQVAADTFGSAGGYPRLLVLDNTDPAAVQAVQEQIEISKTLFIVASKSGTTTETLSFYRYFYQQAEKSNVENPGSHFVAITDPGTPLVEEGRKKHFRKIFENPQDIGGRYSALSYFGLLPMALIGMDLQKLLQSARDMQVSSGASLPVKENPPVALGAFLGMNQRLGRDKVTFLLSDSIRSFGYWVEQLIAESTGKEGHGLLPVEGEPPLSGGKYGNDRLFVFINVKGESIKGAEKLKESGHPFAEITLPGKYALGGEFYRWELATAVAGRVINVNPFDEPNVSESKKNTRELLLQYQEKGNLPESNAVLQEGEIKVFAADSDAGFSAAGYSGLQKLLSAYLKTADYPDYIALLAYFHQTPSRHEKLQKIRAELFRKTGLATTLGYGPRYLHSTGQLHKGGPNRGLFILFTAQSAAELPVPGEEYDFAVLQRAQALGDLQSLQGHDRRVIRIHLGTDVEAGLQKISQALQ
ncbi:MAG: bifunctional transaldolase/phosoglucose isomerase [Calditrichia bacterium]